MSRASARRLSRSISAFCPAIRWSSPAILGAALFGAAFAFIPGYLQAKRDSHIVITTIMFNYIASALMGYLLVNVLRVPGQMNPETPGFSVYGMCRSSMSCWRRSESIGRSRRSTCRSCSRSPPLSRSGS